MQPCDAAPGAPAPAIAGVVMDDELEARRTAKAVAEASRDAGATRPVGRARTTRKRGPSLAALRKMPLGDASIELAKLTGLIADDWQEEWVRDTMERDPTGAVWAYFEAAAVIPRQNGKGGLLEIKSLAHLFLVDDCRLIVHSAHEFATALKAFRRLEALIEDTPILAKEVAKVSNSHGEEGITLRDGSAIEFRTRTKGGGRGFSCDLLILDEAMELREYAMAALLPTLSARPNPQVIYTGSAVDQMVHEHGLVLARVRERGHAGDPDLLYVEFAAEISLEDVLRDPDLMDDPVLWAQANPAYPHRITERYLRREIKALSARSFAVERLGIGDWPVTDPAAASIIDLAKWKTLLDGDSSLPGAIRLAVDVAPDRSSASISAAGERADGMTHIEVVDYHEGTAWVAARVAQLVERHDIAEPVRADAVGPVGSLLNAIERLGVKVKTVSASEYAGACGQLFDHVEQQTLRHMGSPELDAAVRGASTRPLADSWVWGRKKSTVDISPLVSCTLAAWDADGAPAGEFSFGFG